MYIIIHRLFLDLNISMFLIVNISVKVFVHEAHGLPGGDLPDPPDPYVKVQFCLLACSDTKI